MFENAEIIKEGIWKYSGSVECRVRIIKWNILYGTGDYEDLQEVSNDKEIKCYYVLMESIAEKGKFPVSRGGFLTLEDAEEDIKMCIGDAIKWIL